MGTIHNSLTVSHKLQVVDVIILLSQQVIVVVLKVHVQRAQLFTRT